MSFRGNLQSDSLWLWSWLQCGCHWHRTAKPAGHPPPELPELWCECRPAPVVFFFLRHSLLGWQMQAKHVVNAKQSPCSCELSQGQAPCSCASAKVSVAYSHWFFGFVLVGAVLRTQLIVARNMSTVVTKPKAESESAKL